MGRKKNLGASGSNVDHGFTGVNSSNVEMHSCCSLVHTESSGR